MLCKLCCSVKEEGQLNGNEDAHRHTEAMPNKRKKADLDRMKQF